MSKKTTYQCDLCRCKIDEAYDGYKYNFYMSLNVGNDFVDRIIHTDSCDATKHICKECVEKILESVFSGRVDKNCKGKVCPKCGSDHLACGYNTEVHEHRYYCCRCTSSFSIKEIEEVSKEIEIGN